MSGYDFLKGVRVIEVAQLGPDSLGGYLADMGAEVIKVEGLDGDTVRKGGSPAVGSEDGVSFLHLRWNRGKKSIGIDLKSDDGAALFRRLVKGADIVIEGMRAGVLDRLGLGYDALCSENAKLVYCSLSGLGLTGPYRTLGSHGPSFDAFGALGSTNPMAFTPDEQVKSQINLVGMHAMGLYAALGVLSALTRARQTGEGALIEVAAAETAAHWKPDGVDVALNPGKLFERPGFLGADKRQAWWPRLFRYDCADGKGIMFQGYSKKFWKRFCDAVSRPDLYAAYEAEREVNEIDAEVYKELRAIFETRTREDWMTFFIEYDVPGGVANTVAELACDPHFLARDNVYEVAAPGVGTLRLTSTPVKTPGQAFAPRLAPDQWQDTDDVASAVLGLTANELADLRASRAIY